MNTKLIDNLEKFGAADACPDAMKWIGDRTPAQAWQECPRPDWLLWWVVKNIGKPGWPTHSELVRVTVDCVRPVVDSHHPDPKHPCQIALATALAWTRGEATAAYAAGAADAARASYADRSASYAARSAAYAAYAAYAARAAYAAAEHTRMCEVIRAEWPLPDALKEEK